MTEAVVTSFSPAGERQYGRRMVQTFRAHWPGTPLVVYADVQTSLQGCEVRLTMEIPGWREIAAQLPRSNPEAPRPDRYTWQARRFAVKPFVWRDAARRLGSGLLTWLDGDTVTTAAVPDGFSARLMGEAVVAYLGRGSMHPETGYVGFRLPEAMPLLEWCCETYASGRFRTIASGWTDCHVLRAGLEAVPVPAVNLTAGAYVGKSHVWPVSPLAPYLTHYKGAQKWRAA
jgi:hypothetical protein